MLVSSIRGADSLNFNPNITANSFNRINAVKAVVKQPQQQQADEFVLSEAAAGLLQQSTQPDQVTPELLAENPGTAYGRSANDLRNGGMLQQLMGQEVADDTAPQIMGENPAAPETTGNGAPATSSQTSGDVTQSPVTEEAAEAEEKQATEPARPNGANGEPLTDEEVQMIQELETRDMEVRTHEQAHIAASGGYSSGSASFEYQKGPDGKRYAVGGEVQIDTSPEATPEATVQKMQTVRKAALAPAQPSGQDRAVAAAASQAEMEARQEMREETVEEVDESQETEQSAEETAPAESAANQAGETSDASAAQSIDYSDAENYQDAQNQNPAAASEAASAAPQAAPVQPASNINTIGSASLSYSQSYAKAAYGVVA